MKRIWDKISRREKTAVVVGILCLAILMGVRFLVFPILESRDVLRRQLNAKQLMLDEMKALCRQHAMLSASIADARDLAAKRSKNFSLFAFLDQMAGETGIKDRVVFMKPSRLQESAGEVAIERVELKLQGLSLKELTEYLYAIETSPNIMTISRLSVLRTEKNGGAVDALFQVESPHLS